MASQVTIPIRWRDVDAYGHVNNAVFLNYLEEARDRLVTDLFGERAWDFVVARVAIDYRAELGQGDGDAVVSCRVTGFGRSSVRTAEEVRKPDGTLVAEAESVVVARDPSTGRSRPLTDDEHRVLERAVEAGSDGARTEFGAGAEPPNERPTGAAGSDGRGRSGPGTSPT